MGSSVMHPNRAAMVAVFVVATVGSVAAPAQASGPDALGTPGSPASSVAAPRGDIRPPISAANWLAYRNSIFNSTVAMPTEVVRDLVAITPSNKALRWRVIGGHRYVLLQTMRRDALGTPGQRVTLKADRWLSVPSQVAVRCAAARCSTMNDRALDLRLKQMLGLPPDGDYRFVNQLWIRASDLFSTLHRPAGDHHDLPDPGSGRRTGLGSRGRHRHLDFLWIQTNYAWRAPTNFTGVNHFSCAVRWLRSGLLRPALDSPRLRL